MTAEQTELVQQIATILASNENVKAAWLAGSLGRGAGDDVSDMDIVAIFANEPRSDVAQTLKNEIRARFNPLLFNLLFGGAVLNVVSEGWQRFDITLIDVDELRRYDGSILTPLFNDTSFEPSANFPADYRTSEGTLIPIVEEFLRIIGLAPIGMARGDLVLMVSGIEHLRRLTINLFLEENRVAPWNRGGALTQKALLTPEQYAALATLPPLIAEHSSIKANNEAFAKIFLTRAKQLCANCGAPWPERFEIATRDHLARTLGFAI